MKPTLATRKSNVELSRLDLRTFPIWEYALDEEGVDGRDETWIKPVASTTIHPNCYSQIVAATFDCAALSTPLSGFMMVTTASKKLVLKGESYDSQGISPGAIITESDGYHHIPVEARIEAFRTPLRTARISSERASLAKLFGLEANQLFPLNYQLLVNIEGESSLRNGIID